MMAEHGMLGAGGSGSNYQTTSSYHPYPPPLALYQNLVASRELFMDTLKKLHATMGTKFMIPIVGGRNLDLHRLFVEVTYRGGIAKVVKDRKWKEVTAVFNFPSSATNASFILRKYYISLLYHYEQIYYFKATCWTPTPADATQKLSTPTAPAHGLPEYVSRPKDNASTSMPEVSLTPSVGSPVCGVIDGKFDGGYLVTVKIGLEEFKGVLYQVPNNEAPTQTESAKPRRKRRKKSDVKKRDPAHPKPNRSGYNFFFAEQHALLKPHYHGKDREIGRIIGESWNKLQESERAVYQEKAFKDKERYRIEMEEYRERLRTMPIQQGRLSSNSDGYESADRESDFEEYSISDMELTDVNVEVLDNDAFDLETRTDNKNIGHGINMVDQSKASSSNNNNIIVFDEDGISVPIQESQQPPTY